MNTYIYFAVPFNLLVTSLVYLRLQDVDKKVDYINARIKTCIKHL